MAVAGALIVVSCGSDDEDEDDSAAVVADSTSITTTVGPAVSTGSIELAEWARQVSNAWSGLLQSRADAAAAIAASGDGVRRVERTQQYYDAELAAFDAFVAAVPAATGDATLDEPLDDLVAAAEAVRDAAAAGRDLGATDPDRLQAELDEVGDAGFPETEFGAAYIAYDELDGPLIDACFAVQDAMISSDLEFLDCTGSGVDTDGATATDGTSSTPPATDAPTATEAPPTTTDAPPTTEPPESVPTLSESRGARSGAGSRIEPGRYRSAAPRVSAGYELVSEVSALLTPSLVIFGPPGFDPFSSPSMTVFRLAGVPTAENVEAFNGSTNPPVRPITGDDDLTAFFTDTPGLVLLDSGGDETVSWWDVTTESEGDGFECDWGANCLNIVAGDGHGYFIIGNEWTVRIWRFSDADTDSAHVWMQAPADDFDAGLEWAQEIVDGITID